MTALLDQTPLAAETDNAVGGFGTEMGCGEADGAAHRGAHGLPRAGGSADNDEIESGIGSGLEELARIQEPGQSGGGKLDGLGGTCTAPAGAAAVPQALHLPYGNGTTDHELEKVPFEKTTILIDGPPVPRSPDHAGAVEQGDRANGGTSLRSEPVYRASAPSMSQVRTWSSKEATPPPPDSKTYYLCAIQGPSEAVQ